MDGIGIRSSGKPEAIKSPITLTLNDLAIPALSPAPSTEESSMPPFGPPRKIYEEGERVAAVSEGGGCHLNSFTHFLTEPQLDIIVMDVLLPDMNGPEAAKIFRQDKETRDIPIVFVTASVMVSQFLK